MTTTLTLTRENLLERRLACSPDDDGLYIVGVKTTGVYCLPSCKPPRLANPENVEFYASPQEARAAGLRPCKLCRPDDFYLGHHAGEALVEALVADVAKQPELFTNVRSLVSAAGTGSSKLHELFRVHYHTTPAEMLARKRVAAARRLLLRSEQAIADIAFEVGFESLSAFNTNFRRHSAMSPAMYRRLPEEPCFDLVLPRNYRASHMLNFLGHYGAGAIDRVRECTVTTTVRITTGVAVVQVTVHPGKAHCRIVTPELLDIPDREQIYRHVIALLGLANDPARFERSVSTSPELAALIAGQRGLRIPLVADVFDGLVRAIVEQDVNPSVARTLRRRLLARVSREIGDDLYEPLLAERLAALEPRDLTRLGFCQAQAEALSEAARMVAENELPLADLASASATRIERTLRGVRGIGNMAIQHLMMRSLGFLDCVPAGDTALAHGLKSFFALNAHPCETEAQTLMNRFAPYRSLATFHLWQRTGPAM